MRTFKDFLVNEETNYFKIYNGNSIPTAGYYIKKDGLTKNFNDYVYINNIVNLKKFLKENFPNYELNKLLNDIFEHTGEFSDDKYYQFKIGRIPLFTIFNYYEFNKFISK